MARGVHHGVPRGRVRGLGAARALLALLLGGCATLGERPEVEGTLYQTAWPAHDTSRDLTSAFRSVKQVFYTGEYRTHLFPEAAGVTEAEVGRGPPPGGVAPAGAVESFSEAQSKAGTATIVARAGQRLVLLTSNHVVYFEPVRIEYYEPRGAARGVPETPRVVASVSYLVSEEGGFIHHPDLGPFQVLTRDERADVALLGIDLRAWSNPTDFPSLALRAGRAEGLGWGSFVYVLGYPNGFAVATRGLVSNPRRDGAGSFLTDGLWNEGISGGLILGVRRDSGHLEWVGMARAGAAQPEIRARPDTTLFARDPDFVRMYEGPLYVQATLQIVYGVTLAVPEGAIRFFIERSRPVLRSRGFPVPRV